MPTANIIDTELFYTEYGSGTPFLVMHGGLGVDHTYFRPFLDPLGDTFHLIYYDHRGHGRSERSPINAITYEQLADDANVLREKLGHEKIGVIGHSAGGFIALHYAVRHQEHLSYLILLDTSPAFDYMEEVMAIAQQKNPAPEIIATLNAPAASTEKEVKDQMKTMQPLYFSEFTSELEEIMSKVSDKMKMVPELMAHNETLGATYNVSSQLIEIKVPTLILVGKDDFICPPSQAQRMHDKIPNSKLEIFERCGHYPFIEVPDNFFRVVRDWFKKVS